MDVNETMYGGMESTTTSDVVSMVSDDKGHMMDAMDIATHMHWVSSVIVGLVCIVVGIFGNTISMIIWRRKSCRSSTGNYLFAQAIADSGLLVLFLLTDTIVMMAPSIKTIYAYGVFYSYIGYPLLYLFIICSIWLTVGVTVDRYIMVCWIRAAPVSLSIKVLSPINIV